MDRNERARRRAAFSRPREAVERARSLAHGLELEDELEDEIEREKAAHEPRPRRRSTGRFVAIFSVAVFAVSTLGLLVVMADRYQTQVSMRDHGVATQAVIIDKTQSERVYHVSTSYGLDFRFWPRPPSGRAVDDFQVVSGDQFAATSVGQTVTIRYNPHRLSQSTIYFAPPPTDGQMLMGDLLLLGIWIALFGGLCLMIVGLAWPDRPKPTGRSLKARI